MQQKPNHDPPCVFWAVSGVAALTFHISADSAAAPIPSGYIQAAQLAVGKVTTPELQAVKAACLTQLAADAKPLPPQQTQ